MTAAADAAAATAGACSEAAAAAGASGGSVTKEGRWGLEPSVASSAAVGHALRVAKALVAGNFAAFFRCYDEAPNMGQFILDYLVPKVLLSLQ